jgi:hypothetical protein
MNMLNHGALSGSAFIYFILHPFCAISDGD